MKYLDVCLAAAGMASPVVLAVATILVASHRPEYSHLRNTISELGMVGAPRAAWMNLAGVVPAGILIIIAAFAVYRALGAGAFSTSLLLAVGGVCLAGSALSPWSGPANMDLTILTNRFHFIFAMLGFLSISIAPLLFGLRARRLPALEGWFWPSLCAALCIFIVGFWPRQGDYRGALQRISLFAFNLWLFSLCLWIIIHRLRFLSGQSVT